MLDKIIKLTPLTGAVLVFCGVLKLIFYYSHFNIHIIDFLEFQEIITSFFGDINILIVFGMIMILISFATLNHLSRKTNLAIDELYEKILVYLYPKRFKYSFGFLIIIIGMIIFLNYKLFSYHYFVIYILIFCAIQMLTYAFLTKETGGKVDIPNFYGLMIFGISLMFSLYLLAQRDYQNVLKNEIETTIETKDKTIVCNKFTKNLFIGKTSKYLFVFINSTKTTMVIPQEEVVKFEFK